MTERQKYNILKRVDGVEIREYLPCVMADVLVESEYAKAGNIGFRPLVTYISQNNISMTAPVIQEQKDEGLWWVSFVMPANMTLDQLPIPKNSKVSLRESPKYVAAALSFSGMTNWNRVKEKEALLRAVLEKEQLQSVGALQVARFDPPWKPGFMRHNEVMLQIEYP